MVKKSFEKVLKSIFCVLIFGLFVIPAFTLDVPTLNTPVTDKADVINSSDEKALNQKLTNLSNETGIQVAVLTIPSLEGEALESYSMKVVEDWKLGQKGEDNGVLLLVSIGDRSLRIETGYGVEGDLTDTKCGLIIRNVITPHFQNGDYSRGIVQGVTAIVENVAVNFSENSDSPIIYENDDSDDWEGFLVVGIFITFFSIVMISAATSKKNPTSGSNDNKMLKAAIVAKTLMEVAESLSDNDNHHFGGFSGGGFSGGGFGGFSGGGGSFGGGGASGKW